MKGKKLIGLVAFASCVMLAGCGEKPEIVIENMPTNFIIGEEIDFDNYVKFGNTKDYKVLPTEESASFVEINNHKIKVVSDNEIKDIKVRIIAGDKEKDVSFNVISQVKMDILEIVGNAGYNYAVHELYPKSQTSSELVDVGAYYHNENYVYMDRFMPVDTTGTSYVAGGWVNTGSNVFDFTLDKNLKNPIVEPMVEPLKFFKGSNLPFELNALNLEYQKADEEEGFAQDSLVWYEDDDFSLVNFLQGTGLYQEEQQYDTTSKDFLIPMCAIFYVKEVDGEKQMFSDVLAYAYNHKTYCFGANYSYEFKEGGYAIADLDNYVLGTSKPKAVEFSTLENFLSEVFNDEKNYSIETKFQWYDKNGNESKVPSFKDNSEYFEEGDEPLFPNGTQTLAVTDKRVIKYSPNGEDYSYASGLFEEGGIIYDYTRKSATDKSVTINDKYDTMDEIKKEKANFMFDVSDFNYYPEYIFGASVYNKSGKENLFEFNVGYYENLFRKMLSNVPELVTPPTEDFTVGLLGMFDLYKEIDKEPETGNMDYNLYNLLDEKVIILKDDESSCEFKFSLMATYDYSYQISFKICNIGTTSIPEKIESQLVVPNAD